MAVSGIVIRNLNYSDRSEVLEFCKVFWKIPVELGDEYILDKSTDFIEEYTEKTIAEENETNTFSGIALIQQKIVGLHVLRKFTEGELTGVHIANLWVEEKHRGKGIARELIRKGEFWAKSIGAAFINANVLPGNKTIIDISKAYGLSVYKLNIRKRISS